MSHVTHPLPSRLGHGQMARKRVVEEDSADEGSPLESTPPSKRARKNTSREEEDSPVPEPKHNAKGKGKATQEVEVVESDDEDEEGRDDEAGVPNLEDDEKFEEDHGDAVRAAIEAKRKVHGVSNK